METTTEKTIIEINKISKEKLANLLLNINKSTICSVTYIVDDSRSKTVKGQKQIQKKVHISNVYLNHDYTKKVQNLSGDTSFVAKPLIGKTRISGTLLVSDKTNALMLDGKVLNSESAKILTYYHNGNEITELEAISMDLWAGAYYGSSKVETMGRGLVSDEDNFGIINTYLSKIQSIKLEGIKYEIE